MEVKFKVRGREHVLRKDEVIAKMKGVAPEATRALVVEVGGTLYPVKQVLSVAGGLDKADFISHEARRVLQRLGFKVQRLV
jgi:hypothetical protein